MEEGGREGTVTVGVRNSLTGSLPPALLSSPIVHDPWCHQKHPHTSGVWLKLFIKPFNANNVDRINKQGWQDWGKQVPWCESTLNDVIVGELITTTALIGSNNLCD